MSSTRKYNQWSANSPLCRVPDHLRNRCQGPAGCVGSECSSWKKCGPATPFGSYAAHVTVDPVLVRCPRNTDAPVATA